MMIVPGVLSLWGRERPDLHHGKSDLGCRSALYQFGWHVVLQPSVLSVLPSSHCSLAAALRCPSPHSAVVQSASHVAVSAPMAPGSHASTSDCRAPSPQMLLNRHA